MNLPSHIDLNKEFNLFLNLVKNTWNISDISCLENAAKEAFNLGLSEAKLSFNQYFTYEIGKIINQSEELEPLKSRQQITDSKGIHLSSYDSLCCFDSFLNSSVSTIYRHLTQYRPNNYTIQADFIVSTIAEKYPSLLDSAPLKLTKEEQNKHISNYQGFNADNLYFSNTVYRISYEHSLYNKNNGRNFFHSLICGFYTHGLACMTEKNTNSLIIHFYDIYSHFGSLDICMTNHTQIMEKARKHPFMSLFEQVYKFDFPTEEEYQQDYNNYQESSEEEMEDFINKFTDELLKKFSNKEYLDNEKLNKDKIDNIIKQFEYSLNNIHI